MDDLGKSMSILDLQFCASTINCFVSKPTKPPGFFSLQIAEAKRFHLNFSPRSNVPLAVVSGGVERCAADYEIHRTSFPYWGIEFVAQGRGQLILKKKSYELMAGTLFSYGPRIPQDIVSDPDKTLVKYFVDFTGSRAETLLKRCGPSPGKVIQTSAPGDIMVIFDDLIRNGLRDTPFSSQIAALLVEHLILKIAETTIPFGTFDTQAFATYRRCKEWIERKRLEVQTLEQIAVNCHIDPAYLCRLFRRFDYQSPYQYLSRLKMNYAAERLQSPNTSIKEVADDLGFSDSFHFSRVFKKAIGLPPAQFVRFSQRR